MVESSASRCFRTMGGVKVFTGLCSGLIKCQEVLECFCDVLIDIFLFLATLEIHVGTLKNSLALSSVDPTMSEHLASMYFMWPYAI